MRAVESMSKAATAATTAIATATTIATAKRTERYVHLADVVVVGQIRRLAVHIVHLSIQSTQQQQYNTHIANTHWGAHAQQQSSTAAAIVTSNKQTWFSSNM